MGTTDPEGATNELAYPEESNTSPDTLHGYDFGAWTDDDHACMDWDWPCITGNITPIAP